jgi:hypothetical protein
VWSIDGLVTLVSEHVHFLVYHKSQMETVSRERDPCEDCLFQRLSREYRPLRSASRDPCNTKSGFSAVQDRMLHKWCNGRVRPHPSNSILCHSTASAFRSCSCSFMRMQPRYWLAGTLGAIYLVTELASHHLDRIHNSIHTVMTCSLSCKEAFS